MNSIEKRQATNKELLIEQLRKIPIVHVACEKVGISRASYYRFRKDDAEFLRQSNQALMDGSLLVNDLAESKLISAIKDTNMTGIIFWLKNHHPTYATTSIEISSSVGKENLTQQEIEDLAGLLYNPDTFRQGQKLLTSYVLGGNISEKSAQLVLRMFLSQMRAEDIFTRKAEADVMAEIILRKEKKKKYGQ